MTTGATPADRQQPLAQHVFASPAQLRNCGNGATSLLGTSLMSSGNGEELHAVTPTMHITI